MSPSSGPMLLYRSLPSSIPGLYLSRGTCGRYHPLCWAALSPRGRSSAKESSIFLYLYSFALLWPKSKNEVKNDVKKRHPKNPKNIGFCKFDQNGPKRRKTIPHRGQMTKKASAENGKKAWSMTRLRPPLRQASKSVSGAAL